MNCVRCGAKLEANARFCRNCGLPIAVSQSKKGSVSPVAEQADDKTISIAALVEQLHNQSTYAQRPYSQRPQASPQTDNTQSAFPQFSPPPQSQNFYHAREMAPGTYTPVITTPQRRNRVGYVLGCLGTLIVVLLLLGVASVFVLRPYIHNLAVAQMDNAMTSAVNGIPPIGVPIPPGTTVPIAQDTLNGVIANNVMDSSVVQNINVQITQEQVLINFEIYGQDCAITSVPQMQNGKLVATHVTVSGVASLVLSPAEISTLLNSHIEDMQTRINHRVTNIHLADQEIDVTFS